MRWKLSESWPISILCFAKLRLGTRAGFGLACPCHISGVAACIPAGGGGPAMRPCITWRGRGGPCLRRRRWANWRPTRKGVSWRARRRVHSSASGLKALTSYTAWPVIAESGHAASYISCSGFESPAGKDRLSAHPHKERTQQDCVFPDAAGFRGALSGL